MKKSRIVQFILGALVIAFILTFVFSLVIFIRDGEISKTWLWSLVIEFMAILLCLPTITLLIAGENRNTKCEKPTENKIKGL